jgi:dCTP deaminase
MRLLTRSELLESLANPDGGIFLDPLLRTDQVGNVSVDLRVGYDFLVSVLTRRPAIELYPTEHVHKRGIQTYFQETRRRLGEQFVMYPHQLVLATTVEYLSLPPDVYADVTVRSSYARLGLGVVTTLQPGWRGAVPLELFNHGNPPVELVVGSCICQARFFKIDHDVDYFRAGIDRKYFGTIRPAVSKAERDSDLPVLSRMGLMP